MTRKELRRFIFIVLFIVLGVAAFGIAPVPCFACNGEVGTTSSCLVNITITIPPRASLPRDYLNNADLFSVTHTNQSATSLEERVAELVRTNLDKTGVEIIPLSSQTTSPLQGTKIVKLLIRPTD